MITCDNPDGTRTFIAPHDFTLLFLREDYVFPKDRPQQWFNVQASRSLRATSITMPVSRVEGAMLTFLSPNGWVYKVDQSSVRLFVRKRDN